MIRFVDLRGMETGRNFAFWDTCVDRFVKLNQEQAWICILEFITDMQEHYLSLPNTPPCKPPLYFLERFKKLIPKDIPLTFEDAYAEKEEPKLCVDCERHVVGYMMHLCKKVKGAPNAVTGESPYIQLSCFKERSSEGSCGPDADNFEPKE